MYTFKVTALRNSVIHDHSSLFYYFVLIVFAKSRFGTIILSNYTVSLCLKNWKTCDPFMWGCYPTLHTCEKIAIMTSACYYGVFEFKVEKLTIKYQILSSYQLFRKIHFVFSIEAVSYLECLPSLYTSSD